MNKTAMQMLIDYIQERINQLNEADKQFCYDRWDNPEATNWMKTLAREESNKVTFARQELQTMLSKATELRDTVERDGILDAFENGCFHGSEYHSSEFSNKEDYYTQTYQSK